MRFRRTVAAVLFAVVALTGCHGAVAARTDFYGRMQKERAAHGLAPLSWNDQLAAYAASWSKHMAKTDTFAHSNIGSLLGPYNYVGENIADGATSAGALHNALMHSQDHRDNILAPGFTQVGVGVYCEGKTMWVTVDFARSSDLGPGPKYNGGTPFSMATPPSDKVTC